jgi:hypothetical protein
MIVDSRSNPNFEVGYVERVNLWVKKHQVLNYLIDLQFLD